VGEDGTVAVLCGLPEPVFTEDPPESRHMRAESDRFLFSSLLSFCGLLALALGSRLRTTSCSLFRSRSLTNTEESPQSRRLRAESNESYFISAK
jgi:hypothetical protein